MKSLTVLTLGASLSLSGRQQKPVNKIYRGFALINLHLILFGYVDRQE